MKVFFGDKSRENISLGKGHKIITPNINIVSPSNKKF